MTTYYIFDFDSTFIQVEALDELATLALANASEKETLQQKIAAITRDGMEGKTPFAQSLQARLALFQPSKQDIDRLIRVLQRKVSISIKRNKSFFRQFRDTTYIISGGFKEYILPVVVPYGIREDHVLANTFRFNTAGKVIGYDEANVLLRPDGKVQAVKQLHLSGDIYVFGDGFTDLRIKQKGAATAFFAYGENISRENISKKADQTLPNLDEFLYTHNLPRRLSYPKNRIQVLLLDTIDPLAKAALEKEGFPVRIENRGLSESELQDMLKDVSILGIRTRTKITESVLQSARKLLAIGVFSIGTDHVDLAACRHQGIAVFNAPFSNTRSVVELVLGESIILSRAVIDKHTKLHGGTWDKSTKGSHEVRGKTLGIIGYGHIGSQLSVLAEQMGMNVLYFDIMDRLPMGNAKKCKTLTELLKKSDIISVHVAGGRANKPLIGAREFSLMKTGVIFINFSRASVIDNQALAEAVKTGKVGGAGIDVFPQEPKSATEVFESDLRGLPNVFLTPHVGGSTEESQRNIAEFVADKLVHYVNEGTTMMSVNFPNLRLPDMKRVHRFIHVHRNVPGVLAQINSTMAEEKINILGQYLGTNEDIGYVITDVNKTYNARVIDALKNIPDTIRLRVLY